MKFIHTILFLSLLVSCQQNAKVETNKKASENITPIKSLKEFINFYDSDLSYDSIKISVNKHRLGLNADSISIDSVGQVFYNSLLKRIIPFWDGTAWSFDGHTSIPGKGEIACGYFVSTTLQDVGININRYKLAQQNPKNEALTLAQDSPLHVIQEESIKENIEKIKTKIPEGIHFIGLGENHVGYLLKLEEELYLIHSNYISGNGVEIESIEESQVFSFHNTFYIIELSSNKQFLQSWLNRKKFKVKTD